MKVDLDFEALSGEVWVRPLSAWAAYKFQQLDIRDRPGFLLSEGLCDEEGEPLGFSEADVAALSEVNIEIVDYLIAKINAVSGGVITGTDVEDAEKN